MGQKVVKLTESQFKKVVEKTLKRITEEKIQKSEVKK